MTGFLFYAYFWSQFKGKEGGGWTISKQVKLDNTQHVYQANGENKPNQRK